MVEKTDQKSICMQLGWCLIMACLAISCSPPSHAGDSVPPGQDSLYAINGTNLYVQKLGAGPPLILLHGGPGMDHGYFRPHLDALQEDYQLIYFDQRGMGRSAADVDTSTMHMDNFVADIEALRSQLGVEKVHLLGHSWGGLLAMQYAIAHPERLLTLTLINSLGADRQFNDSAAQVQFGRISLADKAERTALLRSEAFKQRDSAAVAAAFHLSFKPSFYAPDLWLDSLRLYIPPDQAERGSLLMPLYQDMRDYDLHPALAQVSVPTLLLNGTYDAMPSVVWDMLESALPDAQQISIPEAGHFPFIEAKGASLEALRAFLAQHSPQS